MKENQLKAAEFWYEDEPKKFEDITARGALVGRSKVMELQGRLHLESKKISNDQELIQSDPTSCPQNQKGNN